MLEVQGNHLPLLVALVVRIVLNRLDLAHKLGLECKLVMKVNTPD